MEASYFLKNIFWGSEEVHFMGRRPEEISHEALRDLPTSSVLFQSSGSSGVQKWIAHTRQTLLASATSVNAHLGVSRDDVFGLFLPDYHVGGFGVLARAYEAKAECVIYEEKWDAIEVLRFIEKHKISIISLVPTQVYDLVKGKLKAPESLRVIIVGGGKLDEKLGREARALGWKVLQSYGMTEAGSQIATPSLASLSSPYSASPLPVLPIWDISVDEAGRLSIRGEALAKGLLQKRVNGWKYQTLKKEYQTQDRVSLEGQEITFLGRIDRTIKVKGELVDLDELEKTVFKKLGQKVAFLSVPDERDGNILNAYIEGKSSVRKDAMQKYLPKYLKVARMKILPKIPLTPLGKVDRKAMKVLSD